MAGAICLGIMAAVPLLPVYVTGCVLAMTASAISVPLLIQMYQENYPDRERGRLFARTMMIRIATAAIFSELAGRLLSHHLEFFQVAAGDFRRGIRAGRVSASGVVPRVR